MSASTPSADLTKRPAEVFGRFPEVLAVYLFGSVAEGRASLQSDLDLAVVPASPAARGRRLDLLGALIGASHELELATHVSAQEIRRELAVHLYAQGKLSAAKARELAEMDVTAFQCLSASREVPVSYGLEDFQDDLVTIQRLALDQ